MNFFMIGEGLEYMKQWMVLTFLAFCLIGIVSAVTAQEKREGFITGKVVAQRGTEVSGWTIRFFDMNAGPTPFTREYGRVPDYIVRSGDDGVFSAKLREGIYHVVALQKAPGKRSRPPEAGDLIYPPMDGRELQPYNVKAGETIDIGAISGAVPFRKEWVVQVKTGIEGTVLDIEGKPVEGVMVFAAPAPGVEIPLYASGDTGKDGKYILGVPEGGRYYVNVWREAPLAVAVKKGQITRGVDIRVTKKRRP
jgi:hypothetical protein